MSCTFTKGDCQVLIKQVPDKSVDCILMDPPFGTTRNYWDSKLNWNLLFEEFFRVLKPDGVLVIHCSVPFNYTLIREAPKPPSYSWYWTKERPTNPLIAKSQPLRNTEEILVWSNKKCRYYPQRFGTETRTFASYGGKSKAATYYGSTTPQPVQTVIGKYRTHHLSFKRNIDKFSTRPDELVELMIKSYTNEGDTILDPSCFHGMSGAIAKRLKRKWIGMDLYHLPTKLMTESRSNES